MGLKSRKSADLKTSPTGASVDTFLAGVADERRRAECQVLRDLIQNETGETPVMWGDSIVVYGQYHYKYATGREGDFLRVGFSPRKSAITVYCMPGFKRYEDLMGRLGRHKHSVSCLYLPRLDDVDLGVLRELVRRSYKDIKEIFPD